MREHILSVVRHWVPIAVAVTAMSGLVYLAGQQTYRMGLNDPQLQLAQDAASRLVDGAMPKSVVSGAVDIGASLAPWVMVYDATGTPVAGGATLEGTAPVPPKGVFEYAKGNGEDRVTWQPRSDVRVATIVEYWRGKSGDGFVVAGRNMREIEGRIGTLGTQAALAWAVTLAATFAAAWVLVPRRPEPREG
ncbi:MAG TPA: hypothetical protein VGK50_01050 [Coriobacteriia bacterium]|jgi:hypothetical protein